MALVIIIEVELEHAVYQILEPTLIQIIT